MRTNIKFIFVVALIAAGLLTAAAQTGKKKKIRKIAKPKAAVVSYKNNVFPLLKQNCLPCHSEAQMNQSELYFESYEDLMQGGKHGKPVVPGKADSSLIVQKLSPKPPFGDQMPMKAKAPLPDSVLRIIKEWINQGAIQN